MTRLVILSKVFLFRNVQRLEHVSHSALDCEQLLSEFGSSFWWWPGTLKVLVDGQVKHAGVDLPIGARNFTGGLANLFPLPDELLVHSFVLARQRPTGQVKGLFDQALLDIFVQRRVTGKTGEVIHLNQIWLHLYVKHNINAQQLETPATHLPSSQVSRKCSIVLGL